MTDVSLVNTSPVAWAEYVPDAAKSEADNATDKAAHDATKPAATEVPKASVFAPIDFAKDVKLPEGFAPDDASAAEFTGILNDPTLSRAEMAQKLVDLQAKNLSGLSEKGKTDWETLQSSWQEQTRKDPSVGGDKLAPALQSIGTLLDQYGTTTPDKGVAFRSVLDVTGAGNHPESVKFLNWVASKLVEGGSTRAPTPADTTVDQARIMFPSMTK